jgi:nucleoside-diphosphate-sugar epimerase
VFHLAGIVAHERRDLPRLTAVNVEGTRILLDAVEPGARLVHVSSVAAVGPGPARDRPADERQPFPDTARRLPYAATNRAGEELALAAATRGTDIVVANPGFLIGPGDVYRVSTWAIGRYLQGTLDSLIGNRDGLRQTVVDLMQLVKEIKARIDVDRDGTPDLSTSRVYYAGQSFGGIYGTPLLALEPDLRAGVVNVAGARSSRSRGSRPASAGSWAPR